MGNLEELRSEARSQTTFGTYASLASVTGSAELDRLKDSLTMGDPDTPPHAGDWWEPAAPAYWPDAQALVASVNAVPAAADLQDGVPKPEPELKQVPPS